MNSFNHFALGSVGQWMYEFQLGITNEHSKGEAGYKHFVLQPLAGGDYTSLSGSYESDYGLISCSWTADGKGRMTSYKASIPANSSATLYLPVATTVTSLGSSKNAVSKGISKRNGVCVAVYELQSGNYEFIIGEHHITLL